MFYLIALILLALPVALLALLLLAWRHLPRWGFAVLMLLLLGGPAAWYRHAEQAWALQVVPAALQVDRIAYRLEESWGFGPGGNEAGIRVYPLPAAVAADIVRRGQAFFDTMLPNPDQAARDWRGDYDQWQATPVALDARWGAPPGQRQRVLTDYICRYGFCIDIDPAVAQQATAALREPGSYYAYGRIGLLLVSPRQQKVYYLING